MVGRTPLRVTGVTVSIVLMMTIPFSTVLGQTEEVIIKGDDRSRPGSVMEYNRGDTAGARSPGSPATTDIPRPSKEEEMDNPRLDRSIRYQADPDTDTNQTELQAPSTNTWIWGVAIGVAVIALAG